VGGVVLGPNGAGGGEPGEPGGAGGPAGEQVQGGAVEQDHGEWGWVGQGELSPVRLLGVISSHCKFYFINISCRSESSKY